MARKTLDPETQLNPTPVILVSCQRPGQRPNLITLAWAGVACSAPPCLSIAVRPQRFSFDIIHETRQFVVALPDESMIQAVDYCGCVSGRDVDKFEKTGLSALPANHVQAPLVGQAPINMECRVTHVLDLGVHHLFVGEILAVHVEESILEGRRINIDKFRPVVYCYGSHEYRAVGPALGAYGFAKDKY